MSLRSIIDTSYKEPSATVKLNGNRVRDVLSIETSSTVNDTLAQATINLMSKPSISPEGKVELYQGYNKSELKTFTGYADTIEYNELDNTWSVTARDVLKKAMDTFLIQEIKFGIDISTGTYFYSTYSNIDGGSFHIHEYDSLDALHTNHPETNGNITNEGAYAHAVVQWMLVMCGFSEGSEIQVENTNFFIGDLSPAHFHLTSIYDAILQIANLIGWRIYADVSGVVRFRKRPRNPSGYDSWTYATTRAPFNADKVTKSSTNTDLRNYIEVRGASGIRSVVRGTSPYIGSTPYRGVLISDELIDTQGIADFMAKRIYNDLNRLKVAVSVEADGNPYVTPATTIKLITKELNGKYLVESIQSNQSAEEGYRMTISAVQYPGDPTPDEEPAPEITAQFTAITSITLGDPTFLIEFDGSASSSTRGAIVQYHWQWPNGTETIDGDPRVWYAIKDTDLEAGVNITLTVTDEFGQVGTTTSGINTDWLNTFVAQKYRHLYAALTTRGIGSIDGGQSWNTQLIPAISVAASNFGPGGAYVASGHAVFGGSDGVIYRTIDGNLTVSGVFTTGSPVRTVYIPEMNSTYALAGCDNGNVYQSVDSGATWHLLKHFSAGVIDLKYAFTNFNNIVILTSGLNHVYESFDGGANFVNYTLGITATKETDGSSTNYYAHTAGVIASSGGSPVELAFAGDAHPYVTAATVMIDRNDGVMIVDNTGQHWVYTSGQFNQTQNNSANLTSHMIRDGEVPMLVYYATQSGVSKSLDRNETIQELYYPIDGTMPTGGWGEMVAYGPLTSKIIPGRLLIRGAIERPYAVAQSGVTLPSLPLAYTTGYYVATSDPETQLWLGDPGTVISESATPGYFIFSAIGNNKIGMVRLIGSGTVFYDEAWFEDADTVMHYYTARFSNVPGKSPGTVHVVRAHSENVADPNDWIQAGTITDFTDQTAAAYNGFFTSSFYGVDRQSYYAATQLARNDSMVVQAVGGLITIFETNLSISYTDRVVKEYNTIENSEGEKYHIDPNEIKFTPHWYTIGRPSTVFPARGDYPDDYGDPGLISDYPGSIIEQPIEKHGNMWLSYQFPDAYYYILTSGLYRVDKYGRGTSELLFSAPTGEEFQVMSCTPGIGLRTDCLAVVHRNIVTSGTFNVAYSTDSGASWVPGPTIHGHGSNAIDSVFYLADNTFDITTL